MATKKKKVRSHVKRVKLQQKKNPVSQEKYEKQNICKNERPQKVVYYAMKRE